MRKRKDEAPLNLPADHPVRRLFQRFRQQKEARLAATRVGGLDPDVERGVVHMENMTVHEVGASTSVVMVMESLTAPVASSSSCSSSQMSHRARLETPVEASGASKTVSKSSELAKPKTSSRFKEAAGKLDLSWNSVSKAESMETLPDRTKLQDDLSLKKTDSCDSGITKSDLRLDNVGDGSVRTPQERSPVQADGKRTFYPIPEHSLQASVLDLKQELKGDIHFLSGRMAMLEAQLAEMLTLLKARKSSGKTARLYGLSQPATPDSDKENETF